MSEYLEFWLARMVAETIWALGVVAAFIIVLLVGYGSLVLWDKWDERKRRRKSK